MIDLEWLEKLNTKGVATVSPANWNERVLEFKSTLLGALRFDGELSRLHEVITPTRINQVRLESIAKLNKDQDKLDWLLNPLYSFTKEILGPDCLRQKMINLVIHMPQDNSSVIPLHSDVLTGNSSFEVGCWIPLTKVAPTNSMFILPYEEWKKSDNWDIENEKFEYICPNEKEVVFFKHFLPHGNRENQSSETRVSLNIRFKGMFAPESKKSLIDYYRVWKTSSFTQIAIKEWKDEN